MEWVKELGPMEWALIAGILFITGIGALLARSSLLMLKEQTRTLVLNRGRTDNDAYIHRTYEINGQFATQTEQHNLVGDILQQLCQEGLLDRGAISNLSIHSGKFNMWAERKEKVSWEVVEQRLKTLLVEKIPDYDQVEFGVSENRFQ